MIDTRSIWSICSSRNRFASMNSRKSPCLRSPVFPFLWSIIGCHLRNNLRKYFKVLFFWRRGSKPVNIGKKSATVGVVPDSMNSQMVCFQSLTISSSPKPIISLEKQWFPIILKTVVKTTSPIFTISPRFRRKNSTISPTFLSLIEAWKSSALSPNSSPRHRDLSDFQWWLQSGAQRMENLLRSSCLMGVALAV